MEIHIFKTKDGYGFRVGGVFQEYDPEKTGFVPMTEERAIEVAEQVKLRIE